MRIRIFTIAVLLLLPGLAYSQGTNPAQTLRARKQYRNTLAIFKEPQIFPPLNSKVEIYRVFIAPTFRHPVSIRMERTRAGYFIYAKRLTGQGGYRWGRLNRQMARRLTQTEWMGLLDLLNATSFWTLPSQDEEAKPNEKGELTVCLDGTSWYLEGVKGGTYQAVDRYCPASKNFKAVGLYMLRLSKLGVRESDVL
jgi:hypothetical protein